ncbi:type IV pilus biogenesis protein PilM [Alkalihalobacterium elongatum]|uniref:type IV pilus biogenesis protein PilM n=1 Tax=Alkalihalobacterium elongatum TaxID=2675466 RepID=UPI001C1F6E82|nr:pilus assembly protein PilM [Alkalihalobacterium elongatum]
MFFNNKYSGIDFREKKVTFATVKMDKQIPVLQEVSETTLTDTVIAGGKIQQKGLLETALRKYLEDHRNASKQAHLAIPTQHSLIRKISSLPDVGETELAKLLQFQIGESIHLPFEEPIYDFVKIGSIVPEKKDKGTASEDDFTLDELTVSVEKELQGPRSEILFFATSRELSEGLLETCEDAGFKPLTAELRALALQRLLLYAHPSWLQETEMIVDVSNDAVDIHIFKDELIVFSRTMEINRTENVIKKNTSDDVLSFADEDFSIQDEVAATFDVTESDTEDSYLEEILNEIQKAQNFYRYSLGERDSEFKRIIVTGENTAKVFNRLQERLPSEVTKIDYNSILDFGFMQHDLLDSCSVAIGLAMRGNEKKDKKKK